MKVIVVMMLVGLVGSQGLNASRGSNGTRPSKAQEQPRGDPWSGLFRVTPIEPRTPTLVTIVPLGSPATRSSPRPQRGPCNMPIVPANPTVDPGMIVPIPAEGPNAKIRVIEPGVCGHASILGPDFVRPPTSDRR